MKLKPLYTIWPLKLLVNKHLSIAVLLHYSIYYIINVITTLKCYTYKNKNIRIFYSFMYQMEFALTAENFVTFT